MQANVRLIGLRLLVSGLLLGNVVNLARADTDPQEAAAEVNRLLGEELGRSRSSAQSVPRVSDELFLRRASLDLIGRLPSPSQIIDFVDDSDPHKRRVLVERLLEDSRFGLNWARYWRDVIMYRRTEERALLAAPALEQFLTASFNDNRPWNEIAAAFITAQGDVREDGEAALIMAQSGQPEETVAEISRIFLGIQIQCAQCHDHPTDAWKREQFHELAAFFPRVAVRPQRNAENPRENTFIVYSRDRFFRTRPNNNNRLVGTAQHYMPDLENPTERGTLMQPTFFATGQSLPLTATDQQRRQSLADWVTAESNPWFANAFVNRLWAELNGEGFYEPVDDLGPERSPKAEKTLEYLSAEFVASGYDVKWLIQVITATDLYHRESRPRRQFDEPPFVANVSQPLRADQLYDALISALDIPQQNLRDRTGGRGRYGNPRVFFNLTFGYDPSEPRAEISASVPQALMLMNSRLITAATEADRFMGLGRLLRTTRNDRDLVVELYLRTLARRPTNDEITTCLGYVRETNDRGEAFEDILWSLLNSTEFSRRT